MSYIDIPSWLRASNPSTTDKRISLWPRGHFVSVTFPHYEKLPEDKIRSAEESVILLGILGNIDSVFVSDIERLGRKHDKYVLIAPFYAPLIDRITRYHSHLSLKPFINNNIGHLVEHCERAMQLHWTTLRNSNNLPIPSGVRGNYHSAMALIRVQPELTVDEYQQCIGMLEQ